MRHKAAGSKSSARSELEGRTLWSAHTGERYFLVPDELPMVEAMPNAPVPEGMIELCTITGRRRLVRDDEMRPYQVDRDVAVEWLQMELEPAIQVLKDAAIAGAERMLEAAGRLRAENEASIAKLKKAWPPTTTRRRSPKPADEDPLDSDDED